MHGFGVNAWVELEQRIRSPIDVLTYSLIFHGTGDLDLVQGLPPCPRDTDCRSFAGAGWFGELWEKVSIGVKSFKRHVGSLMALLSKLSKHCRYR